MKDIRELSKKAYTDREQMPKGHKERFFDRLDRELPRANVPAVRSWGRTGWKLAACMVLLLGVAAMFYRMGRGTSPERGDHPVITGTGDREKPAGISLGDLSPDLRKVEDYYVTAINWELSRIEVDRENKQLFDGYMDRLAELDKEYRALNRELNDIGPNEQTVIALIDNLKMRLQLLYRLKDKLEELKNRTNEEVHQV